MKTTAGFLLSFLFTADLSFRVIFAQNRSKFIEELLREYDSRVPPNFDDEAFTEVTCDVYVGSVDSISEATMSIYFDDFQGNLGEFQSWFYQRPSLDYSMSIFLRQKWVDPRLRFDSLSNETLITLDARMASSLWVPDLFFPNEKDSHFHDVTVPNRYIRIFSNGTLFYSTRVSLTLACPMRLQKFPLDTQICSLVMESYAYTTEKLHFRWRDELPVEIADDLQLPQFRLTGHQYSDCTKHYVTGSFPCLKIDFILERDIGFFMIQTYVPSALVVILSWVSFWINIEAVPARISLGVLTILTMTTQTTGSRQDLPRVSYVKAIDVWMTVCLVFVFGALLEFAVVNVLSRKEVRRMVLLNMRRQSAARHQSKEPRNGVDVLLNSVPTLPTETFVEDPEGKDKARAVDKWSRKIFPSAFIVFNCTYWFTYVLWQPDGRL